MTDRLYALTPDALAMIDAIARTGSLAAAARELGKVPSALTTACTSCKTRWTCCCSTAVRARSVGGKRELPDDLHAG